MGALLRMSDINSGAICLGSQDVRDIPLGVLRRMVGVVPQTPFLFGGSVRENLDPTGEHSDPRLAEVLQRVRLWEAIGKLAEAQTGSGPGPESGNGVGGAAGSGGVRVASVAEGHGSEVVADREAGLGEDER